MPSPKTTRSSYPRLVHSVQEAGVVGMGGAGFPTHRKLRPRLQTIIINGAECEPLLRCDYHVLCVHGEEVRQGAERVARATGAAEIVLAIKEKNAALARAIATQGKGVRFRTLGLADVYPSGDEFYVIRTACERVLPAGTIPVEEGIFVSNAGTFKAIDDAARGVPLAWRFVTVAGAVKRPITVEAPIGAPFRAILAAAGGATSPDFRILEGGVMMGTLAGLDAPVTKTTSGLVVLPGDHPAVLERLRPLEYTIRLADSVCCQCRKCTDLCSRFLLGHAIEPHKIMRLIGLTAGGSLARSAQLPNCSGCGLCSLVACPFDLSPRRLILSSRQALPLPARRDMTVTEPPAAAGDAVISTGRLLRHLRLDEYDHPNTFIGRLPVPPKLAIPCRQHAGVPAVPVVAAGAIVSAGQVLARPPSGALGASIHAPVAGRVAAIGEVIILRTADT